MSVSRPRPACEIGWCGQREALRWVGHPQRGRLLVCPYHERQVRRVDLPVEQGRPTLTD
jgi:hypothetical protein